MDDLLHWSDTERERVGGLSCLAAIKIVAALRREGVTVLCLFEALVVTSS